MKNYISQIMQSFSLKIKVNLLVLLIITGTLSLYSQSYYKPVIQSHVSGSKILPQNDSQECYEIKHEWEFNGSHWRGTYKIPAALYRYYKQKPRNYSDYTRYALSNKDRAILKDIIEKMYKAAHKKHMNELQTLKFVVRFVQNFKYTSDIETTGYGEYPRYPIETLVDGGGDCEDTAILTASLLYEMGYDVVLLDLPRHMAVGVAGINRIDAPYYLYNGKKYYFIETTNPKANIGHIPKKYLKSNAKIYPLQKSKQIYKRSLSNLNVSYTTSFLTTDISNDYYTTNIEIKNNYPYAIKNVKIDIQTFQTPEYKTYDSRKLVIDYIRPNEVIKTNVVIKIPKSGSAILEMKVKETNRPERELIKTVF